jgi:hypothetical protein
MINQLKGALKMLFVLILALGALEIWILKDNRHFSIAITDENCNLVPASNDQRDAFNQFPVGQ